MTNLIKEDTTSNVVAEDMLCLVRRKYGSPDVVALETRPVPRPRTNEVLVRVRASSVTTADWRVRAGAFPGILALPARAMFGVIRDMGESW